MSLNSLVLVFFLISVLEFFSLLLFFFVEITALFGDLFLLFDLPVDVGVLGVKFILSFGLFFMTKFKGIVSGDVFLTEVDAEGMTGVDEGAWSGLDAGKTGGGGRTEVDLCGRPNGGGRAEAGGGKAEADAD